MRNEGASNAPAVEAAKAAGLRYSNLAAPGISRKRAGKGFTFRNPDGVRIDDLDVMRRIKALVIPPAWSDVWISPDPNGHIQAVGRDERGRKQYRYHADFRETRDSAKFAHIMAFAEALPCIRARVSSDMRTSGLAREKVLATIVHLLETTMIRVGSTAYARENQSYGLTTLLDRHVKVDSQGLRFQFTGKSGKTWKLRVDDRRIARIVKTCQDIPGQHLFQYVDDGGQPQPVTSGDVNAYLKEISGAEITAKDFRTWTGTVLAAMALAEFETVNSHAHAKKKIKEAIEHVAHRLGNTPTICRKCYVHPKVLTAFLDGALLLKFRDDIDDEIADERMKLRPEEAAVLAFLRNRVTQDLGRKAA